MLCKPSVLYLSQWSYDRNTAYNLHFVAEATEMFRKTIKLRKADQDTNPSLNDSRAWVLTPTLLIPGRKKIISQLQSTFLFWESLVNSESTLIQSKSGALLKVLGSENSKDSKEPLAEKAGSLGHLWNDCLIFMSFQMSSLAIQNIFHHCSKPFTCSNSIKSHESVK